MLVGAFSLITNLRLTFVSSSRLRRRSRRCVRIYLWTVQGVSYLLLLVVVFQTFGWGREFQTGSTIYSGVISRHRYLLFFIIPVTLLSIYVNGLIFLYYSLGKCKCMYDSKVTATVAVDKYFFTNIFFQFMISPWRTLSECRFSDRSPTQTG